MNCKQKGFCRSKHLIEATTTILPHTPKRIHPTFWYALVKKTRFDKFTPLKGTRGRTNDTKTVKAVMCEKALSSERVNRKKHS